MLRGRARDHLLPLSLTYMYCNYHVFSTRSFIHSPFHVVSSDFAGSARGIVGHAALTDTSHRSIRPFGKLYTSRSQRTPGTGTGTGYRYIYVRRLIYMSRFVIIILNFYIDISYIYRCTVDLELYIRCAPGASEYLVWLRTKRFWHPAQPKPSCAKWWVEPMQQQELFTDRDLRPHRQNRGRPRRARQ